MGETPPVLLTRSDKVALTFAGALLILAGTTAVFTADSSVGATALIAAGATACFIAMFGNHLKSFSVPGVGSVEIVQALRAKASEQSRRGNEEAAKALDDAADEISRLSTPASEVYEAIRSFIPAGEKRTATLDHLSWAWARRSDQR